MAGYFNITGGVYANKTWCSDLLPFQGALPASAPLVETHLQFAET